MNICQNLSKDNTAGAGPTKRPRNENEVYRGSMEDLIAWNHAEIRKRKDREVHGEVQDPNNPKPGSVVVLSQEDVWEVTDDLQASNEIDLRMPVRTVTPLHIRLKPNEVLGVGVDSNISLLEHEKGFEIISRINDMQRRYTDENGDLLPVDLMAREEARSALRGMNPKFAVGKIISQAELNEEMEQEGYIAENNSYFKLLPNLKLRKAIRNAYIKALKKWSNRSAPESLEDYRQVKKLAAFPHEQWHRLILLTPAGDIPDDQREKLEPIQFEKYQAKLLADLELQDSVAFIKNLNKGFSSVEGMLRKGKITSAEAEGAFLSVVVAEMACDRGGMLLLENHLKNQIYRPVFGRDEETPLEWYLVKEAETARRSGQDNPQARIAALDNYLKRKNILLSQAQLAQLDGSLYQAEGTSPFVSMYGDSRLKDWEYEYLQPIIDLERQYDKIGKQDFITPLHYSSSIPIKITVIDGSLALAKFDEDTEDPPVLNAHSVTRPLTQKLRGQV